MTTFIFRVSHSVVCLVACCLAAQLAGSAAAPVASKPGQLTLHEAYDWYERTGLSVVADLEGYYIDRLPPGVFFSPESFVNPRLTFFFDRPLGQHFYLFMQTRLDRGFDPSSSGFEARLDEYLLRWMPLNESQLNLQAGKFATVVGNWVARHDTWNNPFVTEPLPYENLTIATAYMGSASPQAFLDQRFMEEDLAHKAIWLPVVWGPAYTTGASLFGSLDKLDYAMALKNASLASCPLYWGPEELTWQDPTVELRLGFRPNPKWNHGVSFSYGTYLLPWARSSLPPGRDLSDYNQMTAAFDVGYAWRRWQLWGEVFLNRFQVPSVGNADLLSYYLEAKYKITPQFYGALRWNQQLYGTVPDGLGDRQTWDHNIYRVDGALGYRFNRHLQAKLQYSFSHQNAAWQKGEQLVAAKVTLKF